MHITRFVSSLLFLVLVLGALSDHGTGGWESALRCPTVSCVMAE